MNKEEWKETFSDAMDELADEYAEETEKLKTASDKKTAGTAKRKRALAIGITAGLAAAAALVFGILSWTGVLKNEKKAEDPSGRETVQAAESTENTEKENVQAMENIALVRAEYPPRVVTTEDYNDSVWSEHFEESKMRRELRKSYAGKLDSFTKESVKVLLSDEEELNPLASPANFYLAMSLLAEASEGETREEVLGVLGFDSIEELRETTNAYWNANYCTDLYETSKFASSVWLNQGLPYREDKLLTFKDLYYASVFQGLMGDPAYDAALKDWINEETGDLLSDGIEDLQMDPRGVMDLVTTVYYKAVWGSVFNPEATEEGIFHGTESDSTVSYMRSDGNMSACYSGEHFAAVSLRCGNQSEMIFLLPDEGVDVRSLATDEEALNLIANYENVMNGASEGKVSYPLIHLWLPKFDVSAEKDLKECMQEMGVRSAFSEKTADFSGILDSSDPVFLSKVQNNIRVAIDENGVTAASMIDMMLAGAGVPPMETDFRLDRPFLFALRSDVGDLLFVGIVEQF